MVISQEQSVFRLVDELVLRNPWHHGAELSAHFFDLMRIVAGADGLERGLVDLVLEHPVAREFAGLDVVQNALHFGLGLGGDDARAGDVFAIFGGVRDRVVHVGDAAS